LTVHAANADGFGLTIETVLVFFNFKLSQDKEPQLPVSQVFRRTNN
jgi:hypothetical protein